MYIYIYTYMHNIFLERRRAVVFLHFPSTGKA